MSRALDCEIHLTAKDFRDIIIEGNKASSQDKEKSMIFLGYHLDEILKVEHLTLKNPHELWIGLKGVMITSRQRYCQGVLMSGCTYSF